MYEYLCASVSVVPFFQIVFVSNADPAGPFLREREEENSKL